MRRIQYTQNKTTSPGGDFFVSNFNPLFWGFFLSKVYKFKKGR